MDYYKKFIGKANFVKIICALILIVLVARLIMILGVAVYEMSPQAVDDNHVVTIEGNYTKFANLDLRFIRIRLGSEIINPKTDFPKSLPSTFAGLYFISALMQLPIILIFWWSYGIFKELTIGRTPFVASIFQKIKKIGIIAILFGALFSIVYSILLQVFVIGFTGFTNPINFYLILIGIILLIVSEVLEYGQRLQSEIDETL